MESDQPRYIRSFLLLVLIRLINTQTDFFQWVLFSIEREYKNIGLILLKK
jgi:hypothetical protein